VTTLTDRIVTALSAAGRPLDDDVLAVRVTASSRQAVNQACRALETRGVLRRGPGPDGKIVNTLLDEGHVPDRRPIAAGTDPVRPTVTAHGSVAERGAVGARVPLVGCGKSKVAQPAPAGDLYVGQVFRARKGFVEATGMPWFVLSAKYGLLDPDEVVAPYDLALADQPVSYRRAWGEWVAEQLTLRFGVLTGRHFELHAGSAYTQPLAASLSARGATVATPLAGLSQGSTLAWYAAARAEAGTETVEDTRETQAIREPDAIEGTSIAELVAILGDPEVARPAADFPWGQAESFREAGLYSWWVDAAGAAELTAGLQHFVAPGLIYAGQTGATAWPSGTRRTTTLLDRIGGNHLRGRVTGSTFRLTVAAALRRTTVDPGGEREITAWMREHLRLTAVPVVDRDRLGAVEEAVLAELDPPLNLMGMPATPLRARLSELRNVVSSTR
jgi:hypothetical protein